MYTQWSLARSSPQTADMVTDGDDDLDDPKLDSPHQMDMDTDGDDDDADEPEPATGRRLNQHRTMPSRYMCTAR